MKSLRERLEPQLAELNRQLAPTPIAGGAASQTAAEALAKRPSNQVGTFNLSGEQNRFGANWGKSVTPQRPPPPQVVPPRSAAVADERDRGDAIEEGDGEQAGTECACHPVRRPQAELALR